MLHLGSPLLPTWSPWYTKLAGTRDLEPAIPLLQKMWSVEMAHAKEFLLQEFLRKRRKRGKQCTDSARDKSAYQEIYFHSHRSACIIIQLLDNKHHRKYTLPIYSAKLRLSQLYMWKWWFPAIAYDEFTEKMSMAGFRILKTSDKTSSLVTANWKRQEIWIENSCTVVKVRSKVQSKRARVTVEP